MRRALLLTVALSMLTAGQAAAQSLKVAFHDGRVTVDATAVPVRAILTEWGKVGGTKIVGAEKISGAPLTIKLIDVSEAQALETILRSVAGYMAAPRQAGVGQSAYDRILVMATTSAPPPAAAAAGRPQQPSNAFNGTQRFIPPRVRNEQPEVEEQEEPDENPPNPPVFTFPQPGQQNGFVNQPGQFQNAPPPGPGQGIVVNPSNGGPQTITIAPAQPASPSGPVGVSQPGMMVNPPQPNPATQTPTMIRPPRGGGNQ
ncbi:MAG: hypothetical protein K2Y23_00575 [Cyanobacteria bacterium]|nr:hypothetical protein [Cyanobacteriota bacterium]